VPGTQGEHQLGGLAALGTGRTARIKLVGQEHNSLTELDWPSRVQLDSHPIGFSGRMAEAVIAVFGKPGYGRVRMLIVDRIDKIPRGGPDGCQRLLRPRTWVGVKMITFVFVKLMIGAFMHHDGSRVNR
jgi:hypothetical protein